MTLELLADVEDARPFGCAKPFVPVGRLNDHCQDQSRRAYDKMTLATLGLLAGMITSSPFLPVVFTL